MSDTQSKLTKKEASEILYRLDTMASQIRSKFASMGLSQETAKELVNDLDRVADLVEGGSFGPESLLARQVEVLKSAKVLQHDSDEGYMATYNAPMAPKETDADEKYMSAFKDDQSQAVATGKSESGRPLAP